MNKTTNAVRAAVLGIIDLIFFAQRLIQATPAIDDKKHISLGESAGFKIIEKTSAGSRIFGRGLKDPGHVLSSIGADAQRDDDSEFSESFAVDEDGDDIKILQTPSESFSTCFFVLFTQDLETTLLLTPNEAAICGNPFS